jgi:hypothetical protein
MLSVFALVIFTLCLSASAVNLNVRDPFFCRGLIACPEYAYNKHIGAISLPLRARYLLFALRQFQLMSAAPVFSACRL